jgi:hypothetical protein
MNSETSVRSTLDHGVATELTRIQRGQTLLRVNVEALSSFLTADTDDESNQRRDAARRRLFLARRSTTSDILIELLSRAQALHLEERRLGLPLYSAVWYWDALIEGIHRSAFTPTDIPIYEKLAAGYTTVRESTRVHYESAPLKAAIDTPILTAFANIIGRMKMLLEYLVSSSGDDEAVRQRSIATALLRPAKHINVALLEATLNRGTKMLDEMGESLRRTLDDRSRSPFEGLTGKEWRRLSVLVPELFEGI